ncbi:uncharacterized protein HMPREF1541_08187 [Cyphellophora europaea CBS 101466]|uniref:Sec20 C-terminal domain-containing protein n=1 Tax=Cyphellophora europaea (strain CBS 101466) TaxID=1220924 RepID=W2RL27_CYPE1|nr:uncharacterized protein HMPREF1541_08187 [Cyphellophora europaea CBS 101466]ETN37197.1 hypothetical protein HMPREF1541_08187 [Cyphellophora europaea CBS 101466]
MSSSLTRRLQALNDAYKITLAQIAELQSLPATSPDASTRRADLASDIHDSLKEQEDTLELLRQELDDEPLPARRNSSDERYTERERNADLVGRLTEDLHTARTRYRRAQLQAKRNADNARQKEREALFKRSRGEGQDGAAPLPHGRRPGQEKLTQEEIARNASEDVTRALRRTHDVMTANLQQSQFAQQTLDESQDALKGLAESYGGTSDLLKNSRSLVGQLVRSNKSDTWYLQTAFYMLVVTISWLVFRRLLYGPLWWLVWQPLRLMWWTTMSAAGAVGFGGGHRSLAESSSVLSSSHGIPTFGPGQRVRVELAPKGGGWGGQGTPPPKNSPMVEEMGQMAEDAQQGTVVDDITEEERREQEAQPRNPYKRMMDTKDEL